MIKQPQVPLPIDLAGLLPGFRQQWLETSGATIHLATGGSGPPLLLLHGWPQCLAMWHKVAPALAEHFTVVATDLRGYGDSSKPPSGDDHAAYSKRALARDQVEVMESLGFGEFCLVGHDRGGRVAHRLTLDFPERVRKLMLLDILPTHYLLKNTDRYFATIYWHWFFMMQPAPVPETLLSNSAEFFLGGFARLAGKGGFSPTALAAYRRTFEDGEILHATCEEYRAGGSIDLEHDEVDFGNKRLRCPLWVLWAGHNELYRRVEPLKVWRQYAEQVQGRAVDANHFIPEQAPRETIQEIVSFMGEQR